MIATSFQRRFNNNFQASATYTRTLSMKDDTTGFGYQADNPFDQDADWAQSSGFQKHTFRSNGIVRLPWQFSVSGSYFYGSGAHYNPSSSTRPYSKPGTNRLNIGAPITIPAGVLDRWEGPAMIATGTTWPRNALRGLPLHKVDMRVTKTITLVNNVNIELLGEAVQRVQPEELRRLQHDDHLGLVRPAGGDIGECLRAAAGATRCTSQFLDNGDDGGHGSHGDNGVVGARELSP